ncbi:Probable RNA-directed DNA polymerase from transposon BS [Eumeta japonica]|uniref:Probable RNA-directed DNA polymerase from transposon BS n=1 Tax=Eumeta variegata TaxID=151549 RepID=A0A4C1WYK8_EUMVA|nr:Probable RNA-directed DNA polymerase from transposon BS [Eumeta japonica]
MRVGGSDVLRPPEASSRRSQTDRAKNAALRHASAYPTAKCRPRAQGYIPIPPLTRPDDSVSLDDAEIAECLADSIESQCSHAYPPHDIAHINHIEEEVQHKASLEPKDDLPPVSLREVRTLFKFLKTKKAPGLDEITFPLAWKEAEVIGIHKPGKPRDLPARYRPISLLSGLGKLFERILKTHLSDHLLGKGPIIDEQLGFRPVHSYPQQVIHLVEYISEGFKSKQKTVAVFFDVAKAFDMVWHAGRIYKLHALEVLIILST